MEPADFHYADERFADVQMLRYRLNGFDSLTLQQKLFVYYLSQATLFGRDITFDQFGRYNLSIRKMLEAVFTDLTIDHETDNFRALEVYLSDGKEEKTVTLNRPFQGLLVPPGIWAHEQEFTTGALCLVLASHPYSEDDYIRDYDKYLQIYAK